ncbi:sodium transporter [Oceanobacillus oncorhynchi subsp. incaldanensis]|uniref:ABC transporter permease n=1 Tax=Oceanobacillus oncorhynchi TaxID=545501 RepID=UPI001B04A017|nr:ABC transporter permease [Oceanobacillus oncorhynchi]GIO19119.1 sodium transporter [Oceanobacillus oncorhynchi subsp. incaldanensis]
MQNSLKVAKWEIKRNLKNKTFVIGLFITPALFILFFFLASLFSSDSDEAENMTVYVNDDIGIYEDIEAVNEERDFGWELHPTDTLKSEVTEVNEPYTAYLFINEQSLEENRIATYTSEEADPLFPGQLQALSGPVQVMKAKDSGLSEREINQLLEPVSFAEGTNQDEAATSEGSAIASLEDPWESILPGVFAGLIMLSITFTGMAIFQSASQEKKDKIAEIILSSLTPSELMQGKIIGYFILGLIQVTVYIAVLLPFIISQTDIPILEYLLVPRTLLFVFIALLSYLMFAAIFVGVGATMSDVSSAGNLQGFVMMLPFLPFIIIGPVISNPDGILATVSTYIPFTAPSVLLMRLTMLDDWPWIEIMIAFAVIILSILLFMKIAGKIFKVGILLYGKNATPKEIWKWIRM